MRRRVVERRERPSRAASSPRGDERERSLPDRRKQHVLPEDVADLLETAQPREPRAREDDRVPLAFLEPADPRVDVASRLRDREIGPRREKLGAAARTSRSDAGSRRQLREADAAAAR